jgi:hypothetical protein
MKRSCLCLLPACVFAASVARAEPSDTDKSLAQSLFEQGKQLMKAKKYDEGCPKLEESQRLDPSGGTLLNLALCHELQGKLATAWSDFKGALSLAKKDGREDRIKAASEHIAAIEPKLPWLTVEVSAPSDGQSVTLDGGALGSAAWGTALPLDPGSHQLSATAPGRKPWDGEVSVKLGEKKSLSVPELEIDEQAAAAGKSGETADQPASEGDASTSGGSGKRALGYVLGGVGVVGVGVGAVFGFQTLSKRNESDGECPTDTTCSDRGVELNNQAQTAAWVSNIGIGVGVLSLAVGTYLVLSSGDSDAPEAARVEQRKLGLHSVRVNVGSSGADLGFGGVW